MKIKKRCTRTKLLLVLRKVGWLCRKPRPHKYELKISHTIMPKGGPSPLKSARFVFLQNKVAMSKGCKIDSNKESCECGKDVDEFLVGCKNG